ncbi:cysteine hydrolase family protein [uncultured Clostridium sp.]|uniref:cysteine hydrolase family protein n=1 Tax=uncultured Clostridium sp. TaxID=59620 RepID=UPI0026247A2C|nr:cysteine hydrolase family protein [uncultured Clostridium sp.]
MKNLVLLIIDVQNELINSNPYNKENVINNLKLLIASARKQFVEIIYVQHTSLESSPYSKGLSTWEVYNEVKPIKNDTIFYKNYNSAFYKTSLHQYLQDKNISNLILTGLQTEYCMDATLKSAFDLGYKIYIPKETNTTFDNEFLSGENLYKFYNYTIWNNRFANVISLEESLNFIANS